jgi:DNA-binding winged helix-turn-helix (wHTH) protein
VSSPNAGDGSPEAFWLGDWLVEPRLAQISRGEMKIRLRPRALDVLTCLAGAPGDVVSKREIMDAVWRTSFVTDNVVSQVITELRTALGDDARSPRYIENIPRRGYRLLAPVRPREAAVSVTHDEPEYVLVSADRTHPLRRGETLIGRGFAAGIRVDRPEVSRTHALIIVEGGTATIEDLGSKNGTMVNGRRITRRTGLSAGDEVHLGSPAVILRFGPSSEPTATVEVQASGGRTSIDDRDVS